MTSIYAPHGFVINCIIGWNTDVVLAHNGLRLGEGCLTDSQFSHWILMASFTKPLLCAGRFISTKLDLKMK